MHFYMLIYRKQFIWINHQVLLIVGFLIMFVASRKYYMVSNKPQGIGTSDLVIFLLYMAFAVAQIHNSLFTFRQRYWYVVSLSIYVDNIKGVHRFKTGPVPWTGGPKSGNFVERDRNFFWSGLVLDSLDWTLYLKKKPFFNLIQTYLEFSEFGPDWIANPKSGFSVDWEVDKIFDPVWSKIQVWSGSNFGIALLFAQP